MEIAPIETFDQRFTGLARPRVSPEFDSRLLAESEGADVFVKAIFAKAESDFDCAHVAGIGDDAGDGQQAKGLVIADAHAVDHDRAHLAVEDFVGARQFFFQRG